MNKKLSLILVCIFLFSTNHLLITSVFAENSTSVKVFYKSGNNNNISSDGMGNTIEYSLNIKNIGNSEINLENLAVRYWLNQDLAENFNVTATSNGNMNDDNLLVSFNYLNKSTTYADSYVDVNFSEDAVKLLPNASTGELKIKLVNDENIKINLQNDFSYMKSESDFVENGKITVYYNDVKILGEEPAGVFEDENTNEIPDSNSDENTDTTYSEDAQEETETSSPIPTMKPTQTPNSNYTVQQTPTATVNITATVRPTNTASSTLAPTIKSTPIPTSISKIKPTESLSISQNNTEIKNHKPYMTADDNGFFRPNQKVTRAEVAVAIARVLDFKLNDKFERQYSDISKNHWAAKEIYESTKTGLFNANGKIKFMPDKIATRVELITILSKIKAPNISPVIKIYLPTNKKYWAKKIIEDGIKNKLLSISSNKEYSPDTILTRVELLTMINKTLGRGPLKTNKVMFKDVKNTDWFFEEVAESAYKHDYLIENKNEIEK